MAITFLDGAIGSILMDNCETSVVSQLNLTQPKRVMAVHNSYIEVGSDIICSNTFSASQHAKLDFPLADVIEAGVALAKEAACGKAKVAMDIGPFPKLLAPYGTMSVEECASQYHEIIKAGVTQKPDYIFFETFMDLEMLEIAVKQALLFDIPIACSMSFTKAGKTIMGNSIQDMVERLSAYPLAAIGSNCSLEPKVSLPFAKEFRKHTNLPVVFKPNAGLPQFKDGDMCYEDAELFVLEFEGVEEAQDLWLGGCCGSTPEYIKLLVEKYE